jgi:hypothetical protein
MVALTSTRNKHEETSRHNNSLLRRSFVTGGLAVAAIFLSGCKQKVPDNTLNIRTLPNEKRRLEMADSPTRTTLTANQFTNGIGVTAHALNTSAANLNTAGISLIRTPLQNPIGNVVAPIEALIAGVPNFRMMVFIDAYIYESPTFAEQTAMIDQFAKHVVAIEGPNETNGASTENFSDLGSNNVSSFCNSQYQNMCAGISNWLSNDSNFAGPGGPYINGRKIPFVAGSLTGQVADFQTAGNVSQYCDFGPLHNYPVQCPFNSAVSGGGSVEQWYDMSRQYLVPGKPCVPSEIGHHTNPLDGSDWITETAQAKMLLNAWCDILASGAPFFTTYNLMDSAAYVGGLNTDQDNYGLLHSDGTSKVSARAISTIMSLLGDQSNFSFMPQSYPSVSVTGLTNTGTMGGVLTVAKSDGSFWVVIWNEPQVITGTQGSDMTPVDCYVTVNFGANYEWTIYDPLNQSSDMNGFTPQATVNAMATQGTTPISSGTGTSVGGQSLNILGYPKLVKLVAASSPVAPVTPVTPVVTPTGSVTVAGVYLTSTHGSFIDSNNNTWCLVTGTMGMSVRVNNVVDTTTDDVIKLIYANGKIYQENIQNNYWYKVKPTDSWTSTKAPVT